MATSRANKCEVFRYLGFLGQEIVGDTCGRNFGIHTLRAAFLTVQNPAPSAHESTLLRATKLEIQNRPDLIRGFTGAARIQTISTRKN